TDLNNIAKFQKVIWNSNGNYFFPLLTVTYCYHKVIYGISGLFIENTYHFSGKALNNHAIKTTQVSSKINCVFQCLSVEQCVSYNYQETSSTGRHTCELNRKSFRNAKLEDFQARDGFVYGESVPQTSQSGSCATSPCKNYGICMNIGNDMYECICKATTTGNDCEQWKDNAKDYTLTFPRKSTSDVISAVSLNSSQVSKLTMCTWVNYVTAGWHTLFSYSVKNAANMLAIRCDNTGKCEIIVNNVPSEVHTSPLNDGTWHHLCFSWENIQGSLKFYINGAIRSIKKDVSSSLTIDGTGKLIIGQLQATSVGLEFNASDSFMGRMYGFNMWDAVKSPSEILSLSKQCISETGNLVDWRIFSVKESHGLVNQAMPSVCAFNVSKTANFESSSGEKYIKMPFTTTSLREITICFWSRRKWTKKSTAFHYYSETLKNALRWTFNGATENMIFVANVKTSIYFSPYYDDSWHHFCYTWESTDGRLVVFIDGIVIYNASSVDRAKTIEGTGVLVIGQLCSTLNPFSASDDCFYVNYLTDLNIWKTSLSGHVITAMSKAAGRDLGNKLNWNDVVYGGEVFGGLSLTPTNDVSLNGNSDFYIDFGSTQSASNYVEFQNPIPSVTQFLACYWLWPTNKGGVFAYSTPELADQWATFISTSDASFCINEKWKYGSTVTFNGGWSHFCWRWRNTDGLTELYKDGKLLMSLTGFVTGYTIPGGGYLVLGQEVDSHKGGFSASQALTGFLGHLNIWDNFDAVALSFEEMARGASHFEGNVVPWSSFRSKLYGTVTVVEGSSCTLPDFATQKLREKWCSDNISPTSDCPVLYPLLDTDNNNNGKLLRCYCKNMLLQNSAGHYTYNPGNTGYYTRDPQLRLIKNI
ncbi:uncharacterized protein LOC116296153, partial [Actinia tenebrosa]|uniref:Uncharacterized protein LOC116296153 n=1 Tax=Actinia tenebrosa TaxID=6105 RepID=A0A6P8HXB7_ACTTE